jgi:hypothetical protein
VSYFIVAEAKTFYRGMPTTTTLREYEMAARQKVDIERLVEPTELSRDALKSLIGLAEQGSARLVNWERLGRPAFDHVIATVEVPVAEIGKFVQDAFAIGGLRAKVIGFPRGVVQIDSIQVQVEASS